MKLTILGNSSATPTFNRHPSAQILNINEELILIDCGEGTQMQLRKNHIRMQRINHIFISHLHGDHYLGIVGLISTLHLFGRKNDLHIFSPPELEEIINLQLKVSQVQLNYTIQFHPLTFDASQLVYTHKKFSVTSIPLQHRIPTCGFLFKETEKELKINKDFIEKENPNIEEIINIKKGEDFVNSKGLLYKNSQITTKPNAAKSYAYISDTVFDESIVPLINNVNTLYHEATFLDEFRSVAKDKMHTTAKEAAIIAKQSNVNQLLIGHFSARYEDLAPLLNEAKLIFENTLLAEEGIVFDLN